MTASNGLLHVFLYLVIHFLPSVVERHVGPLPQSHHHGGASQVFVVGYGVDVELPVLLHPGSKYWSKEVLGKVMQHLPVATILYGGDGELKV